MAKALCAVFLVLFTFVLSILFPVGVAALAVWVFDWIFGTSYFTPQVIGILAVIIYAVSNFGKSKE